MKYDIDPLDDDVGVSFEVNIKAKPGSSIEREINKLSNIGKTIARIVQKQQFPSYLFDNEE